MKMRIVSLMLILCMVISMLPISAFAANIVASGVCGDDITWTFDDSGVLTISGTGDMYDYSISPRAPWYAHIGNINTVKIEEGVTGIGEYAFYKHKYLYTVYLPSTLKEAGDAAFLDANYINSVYTPSLESWLSISFGPATSSNPMCYGRYLYIDGDDSITDVVVPESITTLHSYAFLNWKITSLTLHDGVTTIESSAFYNCGTGIKTAGPIGSGSDYEFAWTEELPDYAFQYLSGLTTVIIPDTVERIGNSTFFDCALTGVTIPDSVTSIGNSAFKSCDNLEIVTLSEKLTSVGVSAFEYCNNLKTVYAGPLVNWLGISFQYMSNPMQYADTLYLEGTQPVNVTVPDDVTAIGDYTFLNCGSLGSITMGSGVTRIGNYAFSGCTNLNTVSIGNNVSEIASHAFYDCSSLSSITIPDSILTVTEYAFRSCSNLENIHMGAGIEKIEANAFHECTALSNVHIPELTDWLDIEFGDQTANPAYYGANVYVGDYLLESAVIPDTETEIKAFAFYNVKSLKSVTIPESVNTLATHAFFGCSNLESVVIPGSVQTIGDCAFANCNSMKSATIGNGVHDISVRAFAGCKKLSELSIADTVTAIGEYAFLDCTDLTTVTIPNSVMEIGQYAFSGCTAVEKITLSESLPAIPVGLFYGCTALESISIPASISRIDGGLSCSLRKVFFEGDLPKIAESAFGGVTAYCYYPIENNAYEAVVHQDFGGTLVWVPIGGSESNRYCGENITWSFSEDGTLSITGTGNMYNYSASDSVFAPWYDYLLDIKSIVIEEGVQSIGEDAFHSCTALATVSIPNSVTVIENQAFYQCSALTGVELPDNLLSIGESAFHSCIALTTVSIPNTVTSIADYTFYECSALADVALSENLTSIGAGAFYYCGALTEVVLPESLISIGATAFYHAGLSGLTIPNQVTSIGVQAFSGCENMYSATIGASVADIPDGMFSSCYKLSRVNFQEGLKTIGNSAFANCYELDTFTLPEGLTHIGKNCFAMCGFDSFTSGFSTIILPSSLEYVGDWAFWYCSDLNSVQFSGGKFTLGSCVFQQNQKKITIVFKCVAPTFSADTFGQMVYGVTAYYPSNEESWTSDVLQNYGGKVTWINEEMEITKPDDGTAGDGSEGDSEIPDSGSGDGGNSGTSGSGSDDGTGGEEDTSGCTEHSYTSAVAKPTCAQNGYTTYTCTKCGNYYISDYTTPIGHTEVVDEAVAATCTDTGLTEGSHCSVCGTVITAQETVDALGHNYVDGTCTNCGAAAPNPYEGKTIACVGDSITYGVGVTRDETDYVTLLAKSLGMDYIRLGVSGTTLCTDGIRTCNIGKLTESNLQGADVVTIAMGINDFCAAGGGYYELGDINSTDSSTIYGAVRMWCEQIAELRKTDSLSDTQFYFVTPLITSWNNSVTSARNWDQSKTNIHGYTLRDLCNAIIEVAALYDVAVIDMNLISGLYYVDEQDNNVAVFGGDGVHPGEEGHAMMAAALEDVLLQNYLRDDHDHVYGSWITTTYPDCESGEEKRVCEICTATESRTLEASHNYVDGTCTNCGEADPEAVKMTGSIRARSATLNLLDKVSVVYKCTDDTVVTNNDQVAERGVLLFESKELAATKDSARAYETIILEWNESEQRYIGQSEGIDARDMDKSQFAVAYVKMIDGTYIFGTKDGEDQIIEYSPLIYCTKNKDNALVGELCRAMMHYGAAAQVEQYGMTEGLMNEGFEAVPFDEAVLGDTVFSADTNVTNGLKLRSVTMDLKGAISYVVKFTAEDAEVAAKQLYAEYTLLGESGSVELVEGTDGRLWATISGVPAKDLGATLKVKAYWVNENGERMYSGELVYSGYEYVRRALTNTSYTEAVRDLARALAMYIHYADAYGN